MKAYKIDLYDGENYIGRFTTAELSKMFGVKNNTILEVISKNRDFYRRRYRLIIAGGMTDRAPTNFERTWTEACRSAKQWLIANGRYTGKYEKEEK